MNFPEINSDDYKNFMHLIESKDIDKIANELQNNEEVGKIFQKALLNDYQFIQNNRSTLEGVIEKINNETEKTAKVSRIFQLWGCAPWNEPSFLEIALDLPTDHLIEILSLSIKANKLDLLVHFGSKRRSCPILDFAILEKRPIEDIKKIHNLMSETQRETQFGTFEDEPCFLTWAIKQDMSITDIKELFKLIPENKKELQFELIKEHYFEGSTLGLALTYERPFSDIQQLYELIPENKKELQFERIKNPYFEGSILALALKNKWPFSDIKQLYELIPENKKELQFSESILTLALKNKWPFSDIKQLYELIPDSIKKTQFEWFKTSGYEGSILAIAIKQDMSITDIKELYKFLSEHETEQTKKAEDTVILAEYFYQQNYQTEFDRIQKKILDSFEQHLPFLSKVATLMKYFIEKKQDEIENYLQHLGGYEKLSTEQKLTFLPILKPEEIQTTLQNLDEQSKRTYLDHLIPYDEKWYNTETLIFLAIDQYINPALKTEQELLINLEAEIFRKIPPFSFLCAVQKRTDWMTKLYDYITLTQKIGMTPLLQEEKFDELFERISLQDRLTLIKFSTTETKKKHYGAFELLPKKYADFKKEDIPKELGAYYGYKAGFLTTVALQQLDQIESAFTYRLDDPTFNTELLLEFATCRNKVKEVDRILSENAPKETTEETPEEFLDPITCEVMQRPITLGSGETKQSFDLNTLFGALVETKEELLDVKLTEEGALLLLKNTENGSEHTRAVTQIQNPFTRQPVNTKDLVIDEALQRKIEAWERRSRPEGEPPSKKQKLD